jgi:hypothetical protein
MLETREKLIKEIQQAKLNPPKVKIPLVAKPTHQLDLNRVANKKASKTVKQKKEPNAPKPSPEDKPVP